LKASLGGGSEAERDASDEEFGKSEQ